MPWDQSYSIPTIRDLLEELTGKTGMQLLQEYAEKEGIGVKYGTDIILDDNVDEIKGKRIELEDGRIFIPKKTESHCWNGNEGLDVYEWKEENEEVQVKRFDDNVEITGDEIE